MVKSVVYETETQKVPIKLWTDDVEKAAMDQLKNVSTLPFVFKHVAVMPDVHAGKGATVGTVIATEKAIIPAAVGVDIGCGMMAVKTNLHPGRVQDKLKDLRKEIERTIPVGFNMHLSVVPEVMRDSCWSGYQILAHADSDLYEKALRQLGTLGGGNHFIEVCLDKENNVWLMLHSGSRHIGKALADRHINEAKGLMKKYIIELPDPDLAYLAEDTKEFKAYWNDLQWAQRYAMSNRERMMSLLYKAVKKNHGDFQVTMSVNCHHNYVAKEHHFDKNVFVTRKGAVRARQDDYGIIPGSMGTRSYIVKGKGNAESFCSCSHGAGRRMSRIKAKNTFTEKDLHAQTEGVECRKDSGVLDEIPAAYKDIDEVMANQTDLVEVVAELKQILCVKG